MEVIGGSAMSGAGDVVGAGLVKVCSSDMLSRISGFYGVDCRAPLAAFKKEYIKLMEAIHTAKVADPCADVFSMEDELASIPTELRWADTVPNQVTIEGAKLALDTLMMGAANTTLYLGLISSVSYTSIVVGDTAAQINGTNAWKEAGSSTNFPLVTGGLRLAPSFTAATGAASPVSKTHTAVSFGIVTTGGTVKGCILVVNGTSAVANATGKLYSAGLFTGGDKVVGVGDTLNVTYTAQVTF